MSIFTVISGPNKKYVNLLSCAPCLKVCLRISRMDNSSVALGSGEENIVFQDHLEEMFFQTFKSSKTGFTSLSCIQIIFMIGNTSVGIW